MKKWLVIGVVLLFPCMVQAQKTPPKIDKDLLADKSVCLDPRQISAVVTTEKGKKAKTRTTKADDKVAPLGLVVCEVENALNAYQQSSDVDGDVLPKISSAELDFKTVVDTKGSLGIGLFIVKLFGGSYDKQKTNDVNFTYVPKSLLKTAVEARTAQSFQDELLAVIKGAATAVKQQQAMPPPDGIKDPLVFKQLAVTVSFGVTKGITAGLSIPISIVTISAQLDRTKNNVQSVKLTFAPPPKKDEKPGGM
jgi:hypothetical protein